MFTIQPTASIILLTKNSEKTINSCLRAIFEQELREFEVIVIDSGSTDKTLEIVSHYPVTLKKIKPREFNHGCTRNLGAEMAKGKYLVFLSADALPANKKWLKYLLAPFKGKDVAAVYGRQLPREGTNPVEICFISYTYPAQGKLHTKNDTVRNTPGNIVLLSNVCSTIRSEIWKRFKFNGKNIISEDQEIARRILAADYKIVYKPEAMVYHSHNYSLSNVFRRYLDSGDSMSSIDRRSVDPFESIRYIVDLTVRTVTFVVRSDIKRKIYWLSYAMLYNAAKIVGFICGTRNGRISKSLVYKLSLTRFLTCRGAG